MQLIMKTIVVMLRDAEWAGLIRAALPDHAVIVHPAIAARCEYAVVSRPPAGQLAAINGLEVVFSVNAGIEALLADGVVPPGIPIVRMVDEGLGQGMLEWVLATTLVWHRNLFLYRTAQLAGRWDPQAEKLARDRTVCVLGAGHLGGRVAAALAQLGFVTRTWSRSPKQQSGVTSFAGPDQLLDAVTQADFLINLLPSTPATANLIDAAVLARLAPQAVLINAGRGAQVVDAAVLEALDAGRLRAAVLDVFRTEPLPADHPFWRHSGVYLTPHVAAPTHATTAVEAIVANIRKYEAGGALENVVEHGRGY